MMKAILFAFALTVFAPLTAQAAEGRAGAAHAGPKAGVKKGDKAAADEDAEAAPATPKKKPGKAHDQKKGPKYGKPHPKAAEAEQSGPAKKGGGLKKPGKSGPKKNASAPASAHPHHSGVGRPGHKPGKPWQNHPNRPKAGGASEDASGSSTHHKAGGSKSGIDRDMTLAIGVKGGSGATAQSAQGESNDAGLGMMLRFRPVAPIGLEGSVVRYRDEWGSLQSGTATSWQLSGQAFLLPESMLSFFGSVGYTSTTVVNPGQDNLSDPSTLTKLQGPHVGLGTELALGKRFALDLEGRAIGYLKGNADGPQLGTQVTAGALWYF